MNNNSMLNGGIEKNKAKKKKLRRTGRGWAALGISIFYKRPVVRPLGRTMYLSHIYFFAIHP